MLSWMKIHALGKLFARCQPPMACAMQQEVPFRALDDERGKGKARGGGRIFGPVGNTANAGNGMR